ncbi:hypothetical protein [Acidovorax sp. SUPP2539]|uniref:hypothetical protein n=1 Tax=Acidovorax sp. SUPP2539 TaxID=2920878 RepID=UPI0023DE2099|nr:hypothetical protein [Acidovorax sp. SUPP2539]GKS87689.1 hypothetical protein AVTE2539_00010 [Acidovorax sp. SUPP2539]
MSTAGLKALEGIDDNSLTGQLGRQERGVTLVELTANYTYEILKQRVFKISGRISGTNPALNQLAVYTEDGIGSTVLGQYGSRRSSDSAAPAGEMDSAEVIYLPTVNGPMPIAAQINGRLYAIDADHLNTPRRLTNTQGQVAWQWLITGFGEVNPTTGATNYSQSGQGSAAYAEAVKFDLRYPAGVRSGNPTELQPAPVL